VQSVDRDVTPSYGQLIKEFERLTGVPVLLNTSFISNEPVVMIPEDASGCFAMTRMEELVLENHVVVQAGNMHA
jgi:carbamoyltransferase